MNDEMIGLIERAYKAGYRNGAAGYIGAPDSEEDMAIAQQQSWDMHQAALTAAPASAAEPVVKLATARQKHIDAVNAYNARLELVRAERERGNWSMKVDDEYSAMSEASRDFIKTAQDVADAARAEIGLTIDT